ncbi:MAG: hypothetical protein FWE20_04420 [Defluviitaleaceae bacterium]|nr:hypothetical protein [Defluviitaleaceae bacterium]
MADKTKTLEEFVNPEKERKVNWAAFVEADVANFFNEHELEKMSIEDGNGNKAKLTRQKDDGIKVEYSSTTIL